MKSITLHPVMDWTAESSANKDVFALLKIGCDSCGKACEIEPSKFKKHNSRTRHYYHCTDCFVERWKIYRR